VLTITATNNLLAVILAGISLAVFPARLYGANLECPAFAPPKIDIRIGPLTNKIDTTKSLEQVRAAAKGPHPSPVVGAYLGALQFGIQIDDSVRKIGTGGFCATPEYAKLKLSLGRIIYIPREFIDDPCLRSLARDHEAKHADADAKALDIARPAIESTLQEALRRATTDANASRAEALATLTREIQMGVNRALDDMTAVRERLDAEIDSPAEIEHLRTSCEGRAMPRAGD